MSTTGWTTTMLSYIPFIYLLSGVEFYPEEDPVTMGGYIETDKYTSMRGNVWGNEKDCFDDMRSVYNLDHDEQDDPL